ncbi:polymorphic toxin-type HINT domain-containing protein [Amycolatopsis thermoflava]|uniref:polymorphic toxin-type HINT domain-containing protein n=1 Tax=Amycolatopsis thermoflava TaxID=84480 RepID=UPI0038121F9C
MHRQPERGGLPEGRHQRRDLVHPRRWCGQGRRGRLRRRTCRRVLHRRRARGVHPRTGPRAILQQLRRRHAGSHGADGSTKPIAALKLGDEITNAEPDDPNTQKHVVTAIHITDDDRDFATVTIATPNGPKDIVTTAHHLFWDTTTHTWTEAADLKPAELLDTPGDSHVAVLAVRVYSGTLRTYNLTIDTVHTYDVVAGETPVLVHNSGPDCGVPTGGRNGDQLGREGFHGSDYSLDEIVEFVNGHTGDGNPAMVRPSAAEVETALRQAGPRQLEGQNSSRFDYNGVRVIVNRDVPWRSTAYYRGR